jgi:hypothetical protein
VLHAYHDSGTVDVEALTEVDRKAIAALGMLCYGLGRPVPRAQYLKDIELLLAMMPGQEDTNAYAVISSLIHRKLIDTLPGEAFLPPLAVTELATLLFAQAEDGAHA